MAQTPGLPDGEGQAIVTGACTSCHGVDLITNKKATQQEWAGIVDRMRGYGVTLNDAQVKTLMDYLVKNYSPGGAPAGGAPATAAADEEGKALVSGLCASCHGADLTTSKKADRLEWQGIVDRMKSYGATLDARQTTLLVDYLVQVYGPGGNAPAAAPASAAATAPAAGDGKKLLESFCGGCHDLDLVSGRKGTRSEWQEIVDRMNGRGAGVPEGDVPALVDYLTKTYAAN
jgi:cytochrome c5